MRDTQAIIHLDNLKHNVISLLENVQPDTRFCGVVKADGYGHGAVQIARALLEYGADFLAVALAQEALELREAGITAPILVFTPVENEEDITKLIEADIRLTCFTTNQAQMIKKLAEKLNTEAIIHIKVDSGMSRIGLQNSEAAKAVLEALRSDYTRIEGIYTHFADADNMADDRLTHQQFDHFSKVVEELESNGYSFDIRHCCNSAASIRYPDYHLDMVRLGISLYGYHPDKSMNDLIGLRPVMTVQTKVAHVKQLEAGRIIGYGATYKMAEDGRIATLILGYADGVLRTLSNTGSFIFQGEKLPIVGRVCMDQLMVDVSHTPELQTGDTVTWFGPETVDTYSLFDISEESSSFHYEILTRISKRIPRIYVT